MEELAELNHELYFGNNDNNNNKATSPKKVNAEPMPYYSGEKGWVSPAWNPPTPKMTSSKHNPYNEEGGWIAEEWENAERKNPKLSNHEAAKKYPHPKFHTGKKGWVAPNWEDSFSGSAFKPDHLIKTNNAQTYQPIRWVPLASVANGVNTVVVEIELPGVRKQDIFIEILQQESTAIPLVDDINNSNNIINNNSNAIVLPSSQLTTSYLFVKGFKHNRWDTHKVWEERSYGYFEKSIYIGTNVNRDSPILATFTDGVLTVCIHKPLAINK